MTDNALNPKSSLALFFGLATLGSTVGFLSGSSGPDATVLAALLPAVLSILGGGAAAAVVVKQAVARNELLLTSGIGIAIFSATLMIGSYFGSNHEANVRSAAYADAYNANQALRQIRQWRDLTDYHRRLDQCMHVEIRLNDTRKKLNLPPLSPAQICPPRLLPIPDGSAP